MAPWPRSSTWARSRRATCRRPTEVPRLSTGSSPAAPPHLSGAGALPCPGPGVGRMTPHGRVLDAGPTAGGRGRAPLSAGS
ncbi:hypothetical protein [Ornithinimicrobium kibberense]|uniref:hypothetical protein n=1 Tax=Ornithinimicrobium kibberense TaxID=282060 RepID=UPI0036113480